MKWLPTLLRSRGHGPTPESRKALITSRAALQETVRDWHRVRRATANVQAASLERHHEIVRNHFAQTFHDALLRPEDMPHRREGTT